MNRLTIKKEQILIKQFKIMKPIFKVLLGTAAVLGVAKIAKANCEKNGKCKSHQERKMAMLDKVRNMNDAEYAQFKDDIKNRNFKKIREQIKPTTTVNPTETQN